MAVDTYDPKGVNIAVAGSFIDGFADGEFINVDRDEDSYSLTIGADGKSARARSNNKSATITITLLQTSDANDTLNAFHAADELLAGSGVFPFFLNDINGRTVLVAETAWVQKPSPVSYSNEMSDRVWVIRTDSLKIIVGGN